MRTATRLDMVGSHTMKRLVRIVVRLQSSFNPLMVESSLFLHSLTHSLEVRQVSGVKVANRDDLDNWAPLKALLQ